VSAADPDDVKAILNTQRSRFAQTQGTPTAEQISWTDSRNRLTHQLQRAVDAFQIATGYGWTFWMKVSSFIVSGILAGIAVYAKGNGVFNHVGVILFTAVMAGFLAPIARDLAATLQRLRGA
jgi:hypothetical protein